MISLVIAPVTLYNRVGNITTNALTEKQFGILPINSITANAQFSVKGQTAADTVGGSGVNTVKIIYLDQNYNGPFTETVNLNGTTPVNCVNTNFCYIDQVFVTAGGVDTVISNPSAAGGGFTIYPQVAGAGLPQYPSSTNNSAWNPGTGCHWVPAGKTCYITEFGCATAGTASTSGGLVNLRYMPVGFGNPAFSLAVIPSLWLASLRIIGLNKPIINKYRSPIAIPGPAKVWMTVVPEAVALVVFSGYFQYYEMDTAG